MASVFNSKITEVENKISYIKNLPSKTEVTAVDDKVSANSSNVLSYEHKLKQREDTINDLEMDASYFRGKNYFGDDGIQSYFVFQPTYKYFKKVIDSTDVQAILFMYITGNQKDYQMEKLMLLVHQIVMIKHQF